MDIDFEEFVRVLISIGEEHAHRLNRRDERITQLERELTEMKMLNASLIGEKNELNGRND